MMKTNWWIGILAISVVAAACSHFQTKEAAYLDSVKGRGTQTEVQQALGAPTDSAASGRGETVWVYEADGATVRE